LFVKRVIVAPYVAESAEAWEERWGVTIDAAPAAKPIEPYVPPKLPAIPPREPSKPVPSGPQGHVGGAVPALNINPSQVFDPGDPKNWRGGCDHLKSGGVHGT
jgi:hypothetical protein